MQNHKFNGNCSFSSWCNQFFWLSIFIVTYFLISEAITALWTLWFYFVIEFKLKHFDSRSFTPTDKYSVFTAKVDVYLIKVVLINSSFVRRNGDLTIYDNIIGVGIQNELLFRWKWNLWDNKYFFQLFTHFFLFFFFVLLFDWRLILIWIDLKEKIW